MNTLETRTRITKTTKMESSDEDAIAVVCLMNSLINQKKVRKRRVWSKEWIQAHLTQGTQLHNKTCIHHFLVKELRLTDLQGFRNFLLR